MVRLFGDEAKPLPVWAELAPREQWMDVEAPLGTLDLSNPPPDVRRWHYWEGCDPRGERDFERRLEEWDRQLRSPRSSPTVDPQGKRSLEVQGNALFDAAAAPRVAPTSRVYRNCMRPCTCIHTTLSSENGLG